MQIKTFARVYVNTNASHYSTKDLKICLIMIPSGICDLSQLTTATIVTK